MFDLLATTSTAALTIDVTALRLSMIGTRKSYQEIAMALGCVERSIYNLVDEFNIPYIKVLNTRYVEPADIKAALERKQHNAPARGRGRPKAAA